MIEPTMTPETPLAIALRARREGIRLRIGSAGEIVARLPAGTSEVPAWLREAKETDQWAFGIAVAFCAALERFGGDPSELLHVKTIVVRGVQ